MNAFIIHGTGSNPNGNWFPWMKEKLESIGITTYVPRFPIEEKQNLQNWMNEFEKYRPYISQDTIMIGHSLGPAFILNVLESINIKIKAGFLVCPFVGLLNNEYFDNLNKTFTYKAFDFERIRINCDKFYIYHSNDDPYVPLGKAKFLVKQLGAQFKLIEGGKHLNKDAGYDKFELLFREIKERINGK